MVGDNESKDERGSMFLARRYPPTRTWAHSAKKAQGRLPHEVGAAWSVRSGAWQEELVASLSEQQLHVVCGKEAELAIADVSVFARMDTRVHALSNTHTRER